MKYVTWFAAAALLAVAIVTPLGRRTVGAFRPVAAVPVSLAAKSMSLDDGRPALILLYSMDSELSREMFPAFVELSGRALEQGANVCAYSIDEGMGTLMVSGFLSGHDAAFEPRRILPWAPGELDRQMASIGIGIGPQWTRPLVAVRSRDGHIIYQEQGVRDLGPATTALLEALRSKR